MRNEANAPKCAAVGGRAGTVVLAGLLAATAAAPAQSGAAPHEITGTCVETAATTHSVQVVEFQARPESILLHKSGAAGALSTEARELAVADARTIPLLVDVAAVASEAQRSAIGAGLAQAAVLCAESSPEITEYIQRHVERSQLPRLIAAFAFGTAALSTGSTFDGALSGPVTSLATTAAHGFPPQVGRAGAVTRTPQGPAFLGFQTGGFGPNLGGFRYTSTTDNYVGDPSPVQ